MGVAIFGAVFWVIAYLVSSAFVEQEVLRKIFLIGAISFPIRYGISTGVLWLVGITGPLTGPASLYRRSRLVNHVMRVLTVVVLYAFAAKYSSHPYLALACGAIVFCLSIPENLMRRWTLNEAPDRYFVFVSAVGSFKERLVVVSFAVILQIAFVSFAIL